MKYRPTKSKKWAEYRRNRRIIQEYGLQEARNSGALDTPKQQREQIKKVKKQLKIEKKKQTKQNKGGIHIGENYISSYNKFVSDGGDISSCPFD